jgi:hypothetical protein
MTQSGSNEPQPLFGARLWPLTGSYAFFDSQMEDVAQVLAGWRRGLGQEPVQESQDGGLESALESLQPMSLGNRELLVSTSSTWTAYFSNGRTGADEAPVGQLAKMLQRQAVFVIWWPVPKYWALRFQLFADHPTEFLNHQRTISVGTEDDGRSVFTATGTPMPYEEKDAYRARRIRDRLTPAMVDRYCRAIGIRPFNEDFFGSRFLLLTSRDPRPDIRFTVAEQQARYRFRPLPT